MESCGGNKLPRRNIRGAVPGWPSRRKGINYLVFILIFCIKMFNKYVSQGRLTLNDGSMYDGLWRYGKRSGLGTFCFSNGDVFRGSWRDDVMHGKVRMLLYGLGFCFFIFEYSSG